MDGTFTAVVGLLQSIGLNGGSYKAAGSTLVSQTGAATDTRGAFVAGRMDADPANGKVTFLAGHGYTTTLPISTHPQTNGARFFLNSLFDSPCAVAAGQASVTVTKSAPALTNASSITFTLSWSNAGSGAASTAVLTDTLPAGLTFTS